MPPTKRASQHAAELDEQIADAIRSRTLEENLRIIDEHALTAVAVQTVADIELDPHWRARQLLLDVPNGQGTVRMHNVVPRLSETPGEIRTPAGRSVSDNEAVYMTRAGPELRRDLPACGRPASSDIQN